MNKEKYISFFENCINRNIMRIISFNSMPTCYIPLIKV